MPGYSPPPVEPVSTTLTLRDQRIDLSQRALVVAVVPSPRWARENEVMASVAAAAEAGADLVEVPADPKLLGPAARVASLPLAARVTTAVAARSAAAAGADLLFVPDVNLDTVLHELGSADSADRASGTSPTPPVAVLAQTITELGAARSAAVSASLTTEPHSERPVVYDAMHLSGADLVAETSLALSMGARIVRTQDIAALRRVIEVIASLLEARR